MEFTNPFAKPEDSDDGKKENSSTEQTQETAATSSGSDDTGSEVLDKDPLTPEELKAVIANRIAICDEVKANLQKYAPAIIAHYGLTPSQNRTVVKKILALVK